MDFNNLTTLFQPLIMIGCLVIGYLIKSWEVVPSKLIPTILAISGIIINILVNGLSVEVVVYGALMGLASTGMHQMFKQYIEGDK